MQAGPYLVGLASGVSIFASTALAQTTTKILTVGPGGYKTISAAVSAADNDPDAAIYYDIQVIPGTYTNDFPYVTRPMTIEVHPCCASQQVLLKATKNLPNEKGIILTVASLTVNGLTFTGAKITNGLGGNGAGIDETITIVNSHFVNNGNSNSSYFQHGLYVNQAKMLSVSNSLFCGQLIGHDIKSRAAVTMIQNNQLYDGAANSVLGCNAGSTSLAIDVPNGGAVTISGNQINQGAGSQNYKMVDYGEEGLAYSYNSFLVSQNNFTSTGTPSATAIYDPSCVPVKLSSDYTKSNDDNMFTGVTAIVDPAGCIAPAPQ